jgi:queuine/archaeosine tRNA-ribosyltransferase
MKKTNTPLTDEQVLAYRSEDGSEFVHASFAAELEIELAKAKAEAENQTKWSLKYLDRANKAEERLYFLIVHGGDYVGYAETWNVSIEDLDADMAAAANFNQ